jgi:hypothetical protein
MCIYLVEEWMAKVYVHTWPFFLQGICTYLAIFSTTRYMYIRWPFFLQQGICTYLAIFSTTRYMYILGHFFYNKVYLVVEKMARYVHIPCWRKNGQRMYIYLVVEKMAKYVHIPCRKNGRHFFSNKVYVHTWPFFLQQGICTYLAILSSTRYMYILGHFFYNKVYVHTLAIQVSK